MEYEDFLKISPSEAGIKSTIPIEMNHLAIRYRIEGDFIKAETLLRLALKIERGIYPPNHPKLPHRMNNLTAVLLLQDKLNTAEKTGRESWTLKSGCHDITSERILFLRLTLSFLVGKPANKVLGQLKTLLKNPVPEAAGGIDKMWNYHNALDSFKPKIIAEQFSLLTAILEAHNRRSDYDLETRFPQWANQPEVPLDEPWEEWYDVS